MAPKVHPVDIRDSDFETPGVTSHMPQPWCIDRGVDGFRSSMLLAMLWRRSSGQISGVRTPTCD
jgi:hypothetical protein